MTENQLDRKTDDNVDVYDINSGYEEWNVEAELKNGLYKNGKKYYFRRKNY